MKFAAFAGLSGASAATLGITFQDCGDSTTHGKISDLQPLSITSGVENALTGTGSLDKSITGGAFDMHVTAGGGLINKHYTGDVCESKTFSLPLGLGTMSWGGLACPQATGDVAVVLKVKLSSNLPASLATSDVALTATDQDSESAICANVHIAKQMESTGVSCSSADQAIISGMDSNDFGDKQNTCGTQSYNIFTGAFNHDKFNSCVNSAVGISTGCSDCYATTGEYAAKNCKAKCITGWCKSGCLECTAPAQASLPSCTGVSNGSPTPCMESVQV